MSYRMNSESARLYSMLGQAESKLAELYKVADWGDKKQQAQARLSIPLTREWVQDLKDAIREEEKKESHEYWKGRGPA